ncbi:uroporphyrinogen decarboxylase family protein [Sporomusa malonica]|nr:uroporphyrinogen decarboxylase family protein [Sporomusa malonica]
MSKPINFQCKWDSAEVMPVAMLEAVGISFYQAHTERHAMAFVAEEKKRLEGDSICRIPFCVMVEAQAFGANVVIPDNESGPTLRDYRFTSMEQLAELDEIDLTSGRINEVLHCAQILKNKGNVVAVNVEGPFTILGLLIDSVELFKGIYLHRQLLEKALETIENSIVKYMLTAAEKGAQIISYADPTGARELVGPELFREISGQSTYNILKKVEARLDGAVVHLCGITSLSLEKSGFCQAKSVAVPDARTYGESICQVLAQDKTIKLLGHNCMKSTPAVLKNPVVWQIELN